MANMRLVGDSVPMLINGVSQQSEMIRLPTQVSEQINCTSSVVQGLTKRPPTEFLKQLDTNIDWTNAKIHMISRDENEQYIVVVRSGKIQVFDLEGNEHDVDMVDVISNLAYITLDGEADTHSTPLTAFRLHTVADTTFLVNRNKSVLMDSTSASSSDKPYRAMVWVKSVKDNKLTRITLFSSSSSESPINISVAYKPTLDDDGKHLIDPNHTAAMLAMELKDALKAVGANLAQWKVGHYTNIVYIENSTYDFTVGASNDWSDTYVSVIKDTVPSVAELPSRGFPGMKLKITGDIEDSRQGFWVEFQAADEKLQGLNEDGFSVVEIHEANIDESPGNLRVDNHPFLGKPRSAQVTTEEGTSEVSGGEREMVQYQEGSFAISGLTDNEFYFVKVDLTTGGVPSGVLELQAAPSAGHDTVANIETASATDITLAVAIGGVTDTSAADYSPVKLVRVRVLHGQWLESVAPSCDNDLLYTKFDSATMPHLLVRSSEKDVNGRYRFYFFGGSQKLDKFPLHKWGDRIVGDSDSAADPTFIGSKINDVFEWKNSLGFASGQNFILSERSQYFNFWPITVATSLATARIDVAASGSNMSNFHSIRVFQDELVGFTNEGQFTLSSSDTTLSPTSVYLAQTTKYESSETGQPINIGSSLAFPTSRGDFSAISEYFVREDQMAYVDENTRHVPHYIQGEVTNMSVSPVADSLVVQTDNDKKVLYFYQWFWKGNEKVQSSWSKWTFGSDVISANFIKDILYLVMQASSETKNPELYKLVLTEGDTDGESTYKTVLDRRITFPNHDSATIDLSPHYTIESGTMRVVDSSGRVLSIASQDGNSITLSETPDAENLKDIYVGEIYDSQVEFTRPVMRSRYKENVDLVSRLQIQEYTLYHQNTGYFKVKVYPRSFTETPYEYEMDNLLGGTTLDSASIDSRSFKVPIRADAREMRLVVHNDSHFPHHLVSAQWSARYNSRVYRQ